jgi:hypothetical protein
MRTVAVTAILSAALSRSVMEHRLHRGAPPTSNWRLARYIEDARSITIIGVGHRNEVYN